MDVPGLPRHTVLLVEADGDRRRRFEEALHAARLDVLTCPGPTAPGYSCVGARTGACVLVDRADAIVLDLALDSEEVMEGTSAEELLTLYRSTGLPIVTLGRRGNPIDVEEDGQLVRLSRAADPPQVVARLRRLLAPLRHRPTDRRLRSGG
jgi:hypothetical protein